MTADTPTSHTLLVTAHPVAPSLTHMIAAEIVRTLRAGGGRVEIADLLGEGFDPVFNQTDHAAFNAKGALPDDVLAEQRRIDRADHLVLVYPVYWWSMPALLKGWIDRVFVSGWAFDEDAQGKITKRLGRLKVSLVAIAAASDATYVKRGYDDAMRRQIEAGIFDFCGAPVMSSQLITPERLAAPSALQDIASAVLPAVPRTDADQLPQP